MFEILFYKKEDGTSEIINYLDFLKQKSETDKKLRIQRNKILAYIAALSEKGSALGAPFVKHIDGDIWELRPLNNRIFYFYWKENTYVLLHFFIKKSQKTPRKELETAKRNLHDWIERNDNHERC